MISGVVRSELLDGVERQGVAAMVVDGLDGGTGEEPHRLPDSHSCKQICKAGAKSVQQEAFKGVIVQGAVGVRNVEAMVARVEGDCYGE